MCFLVGDEVVDSDLCMTGDGHNAGEMKVFVKKGAFSYKTINGSYQPCWRWYFLLCCHSGRHIIQTGCNEWHRY